MSNIFFNKDNFISINNDWLDKLENVARQSERQVARLLMHTSHEESVHEMLIAFTNQCVITPNRAIKKSESLYVLQGEIALIFFDEKGMVKEKLIMAPSGSGKPFMYRLCSTPWHTMVSLTSSAIVHEILQGPFVQSNEILPDWVTDKNAEWRRVIKEIQGK
jgi:cupin fold WbuC family metalloprotein